jgi:U3 small nucleolar RNA-associated protein 18
MPRQRSKKLSASREIVQSSSPEPEREDDQSDSDNVSLGKDEEEEELDRLVLGNGAAFKAQLGQNIDVDMEDDSEDGGALAGEYSDGEVGFENVDDAEVRWTTTHCDQR